MKSTIIIQVLFLNQLLPSYNCDTNFVLLLLDDCKFINLCSSFTKITEKDLEDRIEKERKVQEKYELS